MYVKSNNNSAPGLLVLDSEFVSKKPFTSKSPFANQEFSSAELSARSKLRGDMTMMPTNEWQSLFVSIRVIPPCNLELADNSAELNS